MNKEYTKVEKQAMKQLCEGHAAKLFADCFDKDGLKFMQCSGRIENLLNCEKYARSRARYNQALFKPSETTPSDVLKY